MTRSRVPAGRVASVLGGARGEPRVPLRSRRLGCALPLVPQARAAEVRR